MDSRYCGYLLPKQDGGTLQIQVNPTQLSQQMDHPVMELFLDSYGQG